MIQRLGVSSGSQRKRCCNILPYTIGSFCNVNFRLKTYIEKNSRSTTAYNMNNLASYVSVIHGEANDFTLVSYDNLDKSYEDQGIVVQCGESRYCFSNGVILKYCVESESSEVNDLVCPECWISYEVIEETIHTSIKPKKKTFTNRE